jgi:hypothetical protein
MGRVALSKQAQQMTRDHMGYIYGDDRVGVFILYAQLTEAAHREAARAPGLIAAGVIASLARDSSISDLKSSSEQIASKVVVKASFKQSGITKQIEGFVLVRRRHVWAVVAAYAQADEQAGATARRVLDSIKWR